MSEVGKPVKPSKAIPCLAKLFDHLNKCIFSRLFSLYLEGRLLDWTYFKEKRNIKTLCIGYLCCQKMSNLRHEMAKRKGKGKSVHYVQYSL